MTVDGRNKHGLRRSDLDSATRRAVRQRCGFGCVHLLDLAPPVNLLFGPTLFVGSSGPWIVIGDDPLLELHNGPDGDMLLAGVFMTTVAT